MVKLLARPILKILLVVILCLGLGSCAGVGSKPPEAAIATAIAQKLERTQSLLARQLSVSQTTLPHLEVHRVIISHYQWTTLDRPTTGHPRVVQVQGTYQLKGGGLSRRQQHQNRPFKLYLEPPASQEGKDWVGIELATAPSDP
ncbi:MAG: hypothetical protein LVS60_11440 [Nodosilinea sp. LVE1205-7]|jgi:hypothetical protein